MSGPNTCSRLVAVSRARNANSGNQNNGGNSNNQSGQGAGGAQMQTPVPAPDGLPLPAVFSVTNVQAGDLLNVRAQASPSAPILSGYQPNAPVVVLAYLANGWAQISVGETLGYVNGNFLTRGGGVQTQSGMQLGLDMPRHRTVLDPENGR